MDQKNTDQAWRTGSLPERAPLAQAYVPMQEGIIPSYETEKAFARGTLFPGLDLPFMNLVNADVPDTPRKELMALDFVTHELALYLDTHQNDGEAFALYQTFLAMSREAHERYVRRCGPILQTDQLGMESYVWLNDPWPWDVNGRQED